MPDQNVCRRPDDRMLCSFQAQLNPNTFDLLGPFRAIPMTRFIMVRPHRFEAGYIAVFLFCSLQANFNPLYA